MWTLNYLGILVCLWTSLHGSLGKYYHHSGLHHHMSRRDLSHVFGVEDHSLVPEYDIVHPTQVSSSGAFLTHDLSRQSIRVRRHAHQSPKDDIYYNLDAFGDNLHLKLERNRRLLAPDFHVEVLGHDGQILKRHTMENCHWTGTVGSSSRSTVAVSNCDGLHGVAHVDENAYFIKPVPGHLRGKTATNSKGRPHVVYRRTSNLLRNRRSPHTKETVEMHTCGTQDDPRIRLSRSLNETVTNDRDGPAGPGAEKYIESLIVVDPKMANFHGIDAAKQYALTACNIASNLLRDSSLGENPVNFVVSRMQILTTPQPGLIINHHAGNTLESFGKWAERNNNPLDNDENHYDYATLLTRYNICKDKNQPCDTLGLTRTRGMCNFPNSASVNQDNGLMLGMTLAHETGHCLGINHDSENCGDGANIMSSYAPGKVSAFQWSECSKNYVQQFIKSKDSKCLDDQPTKREIITTKPFDMPGSLYDADQQCQLAYGEDARACHGEKFLGDICVKLWCETPEGSGKCKTAQEPAADGTVCGPSKWCKRGQCIDQGSPAPGAQDGGWSKWSETYSKCSRSCGSGVQYKERRCNKPRPKNGGKRCEGTDREYKLCNTNACPKDSSEFRNYQCQRLDNQMFNDQFYSWEWKPSTLKNRCVLGCFIKDTGLGFAFGNVIDGTNCDASSSSKCIQGVCKKVGCDNIIDSQAVFDRCGVCDGDGSSCSLGSKSNSTLAKKDEMPRPGYLLNNAVSYFKTLGFSVDRRGHIASPEHNPDVEDTFHWGVVKSGCTVSCGGGKEQSYAECRRADDGSPVNDARCDISKKPPRQQIHCNRQPCPPSWRAEGWEDCTKTCNGGNRTREVKCMQVAADGIEYDVDPRLCTSKKPATIEACNTMSCQPEWVAQPFGKCSTRCGRGVQKRNVICMQTDKKDNLKEVDESMCDGLPKPPNQEYCNVHNPCPGEGGCGGNLSTDAGSLTSPNFPSDYPNNKECIHYIKVSPGKVIKLDFHTMQIASPERTTTSEKCSGDFVKIMDGECNRYRSETLYCGKDEPAPYISTSNKLCVKFFSDQSQSGQGFKASYVAVDRPENPGDQCGATLISPIGLITSPNYPDPYPGNEMCNTTIKVAKAPIKLAFQAFDVGNTNCDEDYVMLQVQGTDGIRKLCGNNLPDVFNTAANEMTVSFKSGPRIGRAKAGFVATYTSGTTPEELRQQTDKSGIRTFTSKLDDGLVNVPVAKDTIPVPKAVIEIPKDIDVNFKPISRIDSKDASKEMVDDISKSDSKENVEDALLGKAQKLKNALSELDSTSEEGSGSGHDASGDGRDTASKPVAKQQHKQADEASGSGEIDGNDEIKSDTDSSQDDISGKTRSFTKKVKTHPAEERAKVLQQTIMKMKQEGLLQELTGSIINRGSCPDTTKLSCLNLLYSFACNNDDDCFENGMTCCSTKCMYGKKMCIPRVSAVCPLRTPYYQGYKPCKDSAYCGKGAICCIDMAGRHYCNSVISAK